MVFPGIRISEVFKHAALHTWPPFLHPDPDHDKKSVGALVLKRIGFKGHKSHASYGEKPGRPASHRPLTPEALLDYIVHGLDEGLKAMSASARPMHPHTHIIHTAAGGEFSDKKKSDDVVIRYDPPKLADIHNIDTPTGVFTRYAALTNSGKLNLPPSLDNLDNEQVYQAMTEEYLSAVTTPEALFLSNERKKIDGEIYLVPKPENYATLKIKHHDKIKIEHPPGIECSFAEDGFTIIFSKDNVVLGGYHIKSKHLEKKDIEFKEKPYADYTALERGHAYLDLMKPRNRVEVARAYPDHKKVRTVPEEINWKTMRDKWKDYTGMMLEYSNHHNRNAEMLLYTHIWEILSDPQLDRAATYTACKDLRDQWDGRDAAGHDTRPDNTKPTNTIMQNKTGM